MKQVDLPPWPFGSKVRKENSHCRGPTRLAPGYKLEKIGDKAAVWLCMPC